MIDHSSISPLPPSLPPSLSLPPSPSLSLQCPQPESWPFVGEVLLGLKYNPTGASDSLRDKADITVDCGLLGGQLQVV